MFKKITSSYFLKKSLILFQKASLSVFANIFCLPRVFVFRCRFFFLNVWIIEWRPLKFLRFITVNWKTSESREFFLFIGEAGDDQPFVVGSEKSSEYDPNLYLYSVSISMCMLRSEIIRIKSRPCRMGPTLCRVHSMRAWNHSLNEYESLYVVCGGARKLTQLARPCLQCWWYHILLFVLDRNFYFLSIV